VCDRLLLEVPIRGSQQVAEQQVFGRDGSVGLELPDPESGRGLEPQQVILRAPERPVD
jgi:hypothetical protein